ncbi:MAG TPA: GIY-YIG nuclease family protein [Candidatus Gastranaerophilales bacterium]|nr:GIY-YIG nuclease family protein [Candidatus Gastranaerophilales bacterium]
MKDKQYYIYMMTNYKETTLYTGVTNSLERRVYEHKNKLLKSFSSKYNLNKLVYYEIYNDIEQAIIREKQIKSWSRKRKNELVNNLNENWDDLSERWTDCHVEAKASPRNDICSLVVQ